VQDNPHEDRDSRLDKFRQPESDLDLRVRNREGQENNQTQLANEDGREGNTDAKQEVKSGTALEPSHQKVDRHDNQRNEWNIRHEAVGKAKVKRICGEHQRTEQRCLAITADFSDQCM
jgi:hypothetical protein